MNRLPTLSHFNLETMSGIFPGTRPQHVRQVLIDSLASGGEANEQLDIQSTTQWAQLRWYEAAAKPAADGPANEPKMNEITTEDLATVALFVGTAAGEWQGEPLIALSWPTAEHEGGAVVDGALVDALSERLAAAGWRLHACATCAHWWPSEESGRCTWRAASRDDDRAATAPDLDADSLTEPLAAQALLALACTHWQPAAERGSPPRPTPALPAVRPARRALWRRLLPRLDNRQAAHGPDWRTQVMERLSGPGSISAGTEPCVVCPGRSVNLGARSGESAEGDAETWSIWRCNRCHTFYANQWIDRWVRLDSLETEETVARIAPGEAFALLQQIVGPADKGEWTNSFRQLFASRPPLAHQIKRGR